MAIVLLQNVCCGSDKNDIVFIGISEMTLNYDFLTNI